MLGIRITYDDNRTVAARASGGFHSLDPPTIRNSRPTLQPTNTLVMRHLNIRAASFTSGSDAAIIDAIAQIGLVSTIFSSVYQRIVVRRCRYLDYAKAQECYERSAAVGNTNAMVSLGVMFHNGLLGARDYVKARAWFEQAASAGNANAMDWIGSYYESGLGVARDFAEARRWYEKAAGAGYSWAQHHRGMMYYFGKGVPKDYGAAQFAKAAAAGNGASMVQLGLMSINGFGTARDPAAARASYEKAVSAGNLDAMQWLANMLDQGSGGPADHARAARLLLEAAKRGHGGARTALAGPLSFVTAQTRIALKGQLARLGHYSGAIDDLWDNAARATYHAYVKDEVAARRDQVGCLSFQEVHPTVSAKEAAQTQLPPGFKINPAIGVQKEGLLLRQTPVVSGSELADAQAGLDARTGEPIVTFRLNAEGTRKFATYTRDNIGRPFAIVLEG